MDTTTIGKGPGTTRGRETTMRAIVQDAYGGPDVLEFSDIATPVLGDDEVLVRVRAAGLHRGDWHVMTGLPYLIRGVVPTLGLRRPKTPVLGMDVAGTVAAIGGNVTRFQPGDAVFGWTDGAFAEYTSAPRTSWPQAGHPQLRAGRGRPHLRVRRPPRITGRGRAPARPAGPGHRGGRRVGSFAVPLATAFGAQVTGVASTTQLDLIRSLGADQVIDYTRQDVTDGTRHWDLILDCAGRRTLSRLRRALTPRGRWSSSAVKEEGAGWAASTTTSGRSCCPGSWASACAC